MYFPIGEGGWGANEKSKPESLTPQSQLHLWLTYTVQISAMTQRQPSPPFLPTYTV